MLFGRWASRRSEARYPTLWDGLVAAYCPSVQNASGTTLFDLSGYNRNGSIGGTVNLATLWDSTFGGQSVNLDGVDDFVDLGARDFAGSDFTVTCWVKIIPSPVLGFPLSTRSSGAAVGYEFLLGLGGNLNQFTLRLQSSSGSLPQVSLQFPTIALTTENWVFLAMVVRDGSSKVATLQMNEQRADTSSWTGTITTSQNLFLGRRGTTYMNLRLDDIRIYSRALSDHGLNLLSMRRGIAYQPKRVGRYGSVSAPSSFKASWARRQQLIGSGVY